jgi:hypothetical protein
VVSESEGSYDEASTVDRIRESEEELDSTYDSTRDDFAEPSRDEILEQGSRRLKLETEMEKLKQRMQVIRKPVNKQLRSQRLKVFSLMMRTTLVFAMDYLISKHLFSVFETV